MINEHPNVIVEYNPVAGASSRVSQQLKRANIPCIAPNVPIDGCYFYNEDLGLMGSQLAQQVAPMMKSRGWTGSNTDVVMVEIGSLGALNDALYDFYGSLTTLVPGMKHVAASSMSITQSAIGSDGIQINPAYSIDAGYQAFAALLQSIPSGKHMVVNCLGDDTCLGAYQALQKAGRTSDAMLMGWGTEPQAMSLLRRGNTCGWRKARTSSPTRENSSRRWCWPSHPARSCPRKPTRRWRSSPSPGGLAHRPPGWVEASGRRNSRWPRPPSRA